jgi:uncharacterized protein (DUF433 family)
MTQNGIHDRGCGPEIVGTRITVYNLLPYFLDPAATETSIGKSYGLSLEQVSAARAYVLMHADEVLARHLEIEARIAEGNPPEIRERAQRTHERFVKFREWLDQRQQHDATESDETGSSRFPTFDEWLQEHEALSAKAP